MKNIKNNICGIDFSLTNTGITILENDEYFFYIFPKCKPNNMINENIKYIARMNKEKDFNRYIDLAKQIVEVLKKHNVNKVFIEDYALTKIQGYKINLIEGTSVLKTLLFLNDIEIIKKSVCNIKKMATGYGHSEKEEMLKIFLEEFPNMKEEMTNLKKYALDISDSFFVLKSGVNN